jgi:uncharacterized RDD family membrane protein YckC
MKTIELQTTQNVTINYELALLRDRILAFVIDAVLLGFLVFVLSLCTGLMGEGVALIFVYVVMLPITTFYTLFWELLNGGQTLGKMALRIKVVRLDGRPMNFIDHLLRWVFRLFDIWFTAGAIAVVLINSTRRSQRLGDVVSNTAVVKSNPDLYVSLKDILNISTIDNYQPVYPQVRFFSEDDMLVIKQTVERYNLYKNPAHSEAMDLLVQRVCSEMKVPVVEQNQIGFLRTLIKDYIVLTR